MLSGIFGLIKILSLFFINFLKLSDKMKKQGGRDSEKDVEEHLIRSDRANSTTGFKGVHPNDGRYQAVCETSHCRKNYLGRFDTPEQAAQAYLQHQEKEHLQQHVSKKRKAA